MGKVEIIHFHKAPGARIQNWADASSESEEEEAAPARQGEQDSQVVEPTLSSPLETPRSQEDLGHQDTVESRKFKQPQTSEAEPAPAEKAPPKELHDCLPFQAGKKKEEHVGLQGQRKSETPCECSQIFTELIECLREAGVTSPTKFRGIYSNTHELCVPCTAQVLQHLQKERAKRAARQTPIVPVDSKASNNMAVRELRLADILPCPDDASQRKLMRAKRRSKQNAYPVPVPYPVIPLFLCSSYNNGFTHIPQYGNCQ